MSIRFNSPVFVLTSDIDWASVACIEDLLHILDGFSIKPVLMATHESAVVSQRATEGRIELGLHPNFLPGSSHGNSADQVIRHISELFPTATTFRSHSFVDSSHIAAHMIARGLRYDSNLCLYMQSDLVPLRHQSGLVRFPVFWEDDVHWTRQGSWCVDDVIEQFLQPGLKVLNFHPIAVALNIPDAGFYKANKGRVSSYSKEDIERLRHRGSGARTFMIELLTRLQGFDHRFYTFADLYRMIPDKAEAEERGGRENVVSENEYEEYWQGNDAQRQALLKQLYNARNATDPYATSRDFNLRELEISAIRDALPPSGKVIDLGCGNGYTAISLARSGGDHSFVGVDFAETLIEGARTLVAAEDPPLQRVPEFICDDAVEYVTRLASASIDAVITERFLLNLPERKVQQAVVRECFRVLCGGGRLLMCEASSAGFAALNKLRVSCGLPAIEETSTDNVSAVRLDDAEIEDFASRVGFRLVGRLGFSDYFIISRVLHPLLVQPLPPRFAAPINSLARKIQLQLPLDAGVGSNVLWVLEKP
jgi:ubiquinone/menaquinone biosynthesis C-methylase UbiE